MSTLLESLRQLVPADEHEARARARILAHVEGGGPLFRRDRWDGHLTGSAFVLDADARRLLLLFHRKLQRWLQPGGHGEPDEIDPLAVALREAREETGLADLSLHPLAPRPFDLDVHVIPARATEPAHEHLDVRYLFVAPRGAPLRAQEEEAAAVAWVALDEASALGDESVARAVKKILALVGDQEHAARGR
ncbi:MAG: NUDIX domain-containing protein [Polyangiaceae bacterium]|nr:NUDIX domain-containing protein [Polyangiaceae bacterium]